MLRRIPAIALFPLLSGCLDGRMAGTETGNAEVTITARFGIVGADSSAGISNMDLKVMGMNYRMSNDTVGTIWNLPDGKMVDLAAPSDSSELPPVVMAGEMANAEMMLKFPQGDSSLPDSMAYRAFSNPRYIKLTKMMRGVSVPFLFELPNEKTLKLKFGKERIAGWRRGNKLPIEVFFDCGLWAAEVSDKLYQPRKDGEGREYVLLNRNENADTHAKLMSNLPMCFMADSAEIMR